MLQQFTAVALPVILAFAIAAWLNGKAFDAVTKGMTVGFDAVNKRIDDLNASLTALIKAESAVLKLEIRNVESSLAARIKALEDQRPTLYRGN